MLVVIIDSNPGLAGLTLERAAIVKTLKARPTPPTILATQNSQEREVVGVAQNMTGTNHLYGKRILAAIPNLLILPIERKLSSMILADNTLIITKIEPGDLQAVASILGSTFITNYFSGRIAKPAPKISIMSQKEYVKHRQQEANTRIQQLKDEIQLVDDKISSLSAGIAHDKEQITYYQDLASASAKKLDDTYRQCINAGEYKNGKYIHYYSESYCKTQQSNLTAENDTDEKNTKDWLDLLAYDESQLESYQSYVTFFKAQQAATQIGKANLPDELGVFEPPQTIRIVLQTSDSHAIADYVETLIHEYLHYASYTPGKKLSSTFFEEGLTEYFARRIMQDSLEVSTNLGYPIQAKIIAMMAKRIDDNELEDIYFSKDENRLEQALNRVYGDDFYIKHLSLFQALMYTSDPEKVVQFTNAIMDAIGGSHVQESDLGSTTSNF